MTILTKDKLAQLLAQRKADKEAAQRPKPSMPQVASSDTSMSERIAAMKAKLEQQAKSPLAVAIANTSSESPSVVEPVPHKVHTGMDGKLITYNKQQSEFVSTAAAGKSCVLIGAAGTGKTTGTQGAVQELIQSGKVPVLYADGHKHLTSGTPGVIIISYTRRAVNNIRKVQSEDMKANCITAHKLLEFAPVYYEVENEDGSTRNTMRFEPTRNADNPLPSSIHTIVVEESSMLGTDLFMMLIDALQHKVQWIFIGDIEQLPPVFGSAVLGYAMVNLPVIQLTEVYRQALESPIIRLAHHILSGKQILAPKLAEWSESDELTLHPWKKSLTEDVAVRTLGAFFSKLWDTGIYNPDEDMILLPFNKGCGTVELNKHIANHRARTLGRVTHEIVAGFEKHYLTVGDRVMYDREDAEVVEIRRNAVYTGAPTQAASKTLDYWGHNPNFKEDNDHVDDMGDMDIDKLLAAAAGSKEDRVTQSSHAITLRLLDSDVEVTIDKAAEVNNTLLGYAMTIHKAQGSEWRKVYVCFHRSHATMLQRELLYTAITRAREELYVICEKDTFIKGINSQKIKGNSLQRKIEFFKGKKVPGGFNYDWS